ncbi:MAG: Dabb family protein [Planctomycetes bacterium]|nr:Dabb family protein [Planctomycetota bacterium]
MLKHIVLWRYADDLDEAENRENAIKIKAGVEELRYEVDGVVALDVHIQPLAMPGGSADMCLEGIFASRDAFRAFLAHPRYIRMREFIGDCTQDRMCMDFELPPTHVNHHTLL